VAGNYRITHFVFGLWFSPFGFRFSHFIVLLTFYGVSLQDMIGVARDRVKNRDPRQYLGLHWSFAKGDLIGGSFEV